MGFLRTPSANAPAVAEVSFYERGSGSAAVTWAGDEALWVHGPAIYLDWAVNKGRHSESQLFLDVVAEFLSATRDSPLDYMASPLRVPFAPLPEPTERHDASATVTIGFTHGYRCDAAFRPRRLIARLLYSTFWALWNGIVLKIGAEREQWRDDIEALLENLGLQLSYYDQRGFGAFRGGIAPVIATFEGAGTRGRSERRASEALPPSRSGEFERVRRQRPHATSGRVIAFSRTSESLTEGHPDKVADRVADAVLDAVLAEDPHGRVACEVEVNTGRAVVAGALTTNATPDIVRLVRETIAETGYSSPPFGANLDPRISVELDAHGPEVTQRLHWERADLSDPRVVEYRGLILGYASAETEELMPFPIMLAHRICKRLADVRKAEVLPYLSPAGTARVTVRYEGKERGVQRPVEIEQVLISTGIRDGLDAEALVKPDLIEHVLHPILPAALYDERQLDRSPDFFLFNPTGGSSCVERGLSGQHIDVDTYGDSTRYAGAAFSGNDPGNIERSGAYAARNVAKNVVAQQMADRCEARLAYSLGGLHPPSVSIDCFDTEMMPVARIEDLVREHFDLRLEAILDEFDLRRPIFSKTACYGHFGRDDPDFTWERVSSST